MGTVSHSHSLPAYRRGWKGQGRAFRKGVKDRRRGSSRLWVLVSVVQEPQEVCRGEVEKSNSNLEVKRLGAGPFPFVASCDSNYDSLSLISP